MLEEGEEFDIGKFAYNKKDNSEVKDAVGLLHKFGDN